MDPLVSIIIPARNDAQALRLTLDYLERLRGIEAAEIIVAAAGDTKATEDVVAGRARYFMACAFHARGSYERRCRRGYRGCLFLSARGLVSAAERPRRRSNASCEITRFWGELSNTVLQKRCGV